MALEATRMTFKGDMHMVLYVFEVQCSLVTVSSVRVAIWLQ